MAGRRYETLVLIHPDQGEAGSKDVTARIKSLMEDQQATISQILEWGTRELAYPIAKQRRAHYVLFEYRAGVAALREIERNIKLMDPVLRFLSVQQAENAPPATLRQQRPTEPEPTEGDDTTMEFETAEGEGA
jgi:small subunit ribosomal protein S6